MFSNKSSGKLEARTPGRSLGFTLIELMIVVAIVGILAAIAYPSYQDQIRKGRRADAMARMAELQQAYERWYTTNNTYAGFWAALPAAQKVTPSTGATYYALGSEENAQAFIITATPQSATGQSADRCGTLTIDHAGRKTKSGSAAIEECWR